MLKISLLDVLHRVRCKRPTRVFRTEEPEGTQRSRKKDFRVVVRIGTRKRLMNRE